MLSAPEIRTMIDKAQVAKAVAEEQLERLKHAHTVQEAFDAMVAAIPETIQSVDLLAQKCVESGMPSDEAQEHARIEHMRASLTNQIFMHNGCIAACLLILDETVDEIES